MSDAAAARDRPVSLSYRHALRFILLVLTLIGTAVLVTWLMFWSLYQVMG